eukprot:GFYU01059743.1.p1 GENE.GFYU01059743.1~~GFYU01059743.1.p1  ORF type:complete len:332 (+),score=-40.87 GFYU01059743.1:3-998(+)
MLKAKGMYNEVAYTSPLSSSTSHRNNNNMKKRKAALPSPSDQLNAYLEKYMREGEKWPIMCDGNEAKNSSGGLGLFQPASVSPIVKAQMEAARFELDLIINNILSILPPDSNHSTTTTSALQNNTNGVLFGRSRTSNNGDPRMFLCSALPPTPKAFLHPSIYLPRTTMKCPISIHSKLSEYFPTLFRRGGTTSSSSSTWLPPTATGTEVRSSTITPFPRADLREIHASDDDEDGEINRTSYPVILQRPLHLMGPLSYHALTALPAYPTAAPSRLPPDHDLPPRAATAPSLSSSSSGGRGPPDTEGSRFDDVTATYNQLESAWEKINAHLAL